MFTAGILLPGRSRDKIPIWIGCVVILKKNEELVSQNEKFSAESIPFRNAARRRHFDTVHGNFACTF